MGIPSLGWAQHIPTYLGEPGSLSDRYLTPVEVRDILHDANGTFDSCLQETVATDLPGEVTLTFAIGADGLPKEILLELETVEGFDRLSDCILAAVNEFEFPAHDGDTLEIAYPIVFVNDQKGKRTIPYPIVFVKPRERTLLLLNIPPSLSVQERERLQKLLFP